MLGDDQRLGEHHRFRRTVFHHVRKVDDPEGVAGALVGLALGDVGVPFALLRFGQIGGAFLIAPEHLE
jgi:hypothetical protein